MDGFRMKNKKITKIAITLLILGAMLMAIIPSMALDPTQNETIEMNGVKFDAPKTSNYTIDKAKGPTGAWTWTYDDPEHEFYVYVCDERAEEYSVTEKWSDLEGYTQMRPVGDKWVVVCSMQSDIKDMVFNSARIE